MSVTVQSVKRSDLNAVYLQMAAEHFDKNEVTEGKVIFMAICQEPRDDENAVYSQMAKLQGLAEGETAAGKLYFFDLEGKSSPAAQKSAAIYAHLRILSAQKTPIPPSVLLKNAQNITEDSNWEGLKKVALVGLGAATFGLAVGGVIYCYRQRTNGMDDNQQQPPLHDKTDDALSERWSLHDQKDHWSPLPSQIIRPRGILIANELPLKSTHSASDFMMLASDRPDPMDANNDDYYYVGTIERRKLGSSENNYCPPQENKADLYHPDPEKSPFDPESQKFEPQHAQNDVARFNELERSLERSNELQRSADLKG